MGLTVKRDDQLTSLFDKFASLPEDKKDSLLTKSLTEKETSDSEKKKKK